MDKIKFVLDILKDKHEKSGGHCGTKLVDIDLEIKELKSIVNQLYLAGKITVHDNAHGKIIKWKK